MGKSFFVGNKANYPDNFPMQTAYLGQDPDINSLHNVHDAGVYGVYHCSQAPTQDIGVLEILPYSNDWCMQRFTIINDIPLAHQYVRFWYYGNAWSEWDKKW